MKDKNRIEAILSMKGGNERADAYIELSLQMPQDEEWDLTLAEMESVTAALAKETRLNESLLWGFLMNAPAHPGLCRAAIKNVLDPSKNSGPEWNYLCKRYPKIKAILNRSGASSGWTDKQCDHALRKYL